LKHQCSVIIPVYNSETTLGELTSRLKPVLSNLFSAYEIIFVVDGTPDQSWSVIQTLVKKDNHLRAFNLMRNFGQHNALLCGILAAQYELIVTLDDDLQQPPEELPKLVEKMNEGFDVVYGIPEQEHHGAFRDFASTFTKIVLSSVMGAKLARNVSAFRLFRTEIRQAFIDFHGPFINIDVLLSWGTTNFGSTQVQHIARPKGKSAYSTRRLFTHAINLITGFSTLPLQISSIIGFFFALVGIVILAYVLLRYILFGVVVPGFTFLASTIAFFSGATLFALGIIGEYLSRMYFRIMDKPKFIIRHSVENKKGKKRIRFDKTI
jgi:glycosyltransferase involved in cell wall biosynthesis